MHRQPGSPKKPCKVTAGGEHQWIIRKRTWAEFEILTVRAGMSEDHIRMKLFEAVYEFEVAYA